MQQPSEKQKKSTNAGEATQRAAALAALSSAFSPSDASKSSSSLKSPTRQSQGSSQRAAAVAALTGVLTAEQSSQPSTPQQLSRGSSPVTPKATGNCEIFASCDVCNEKFTSDLFSSTYRRNISKLVEIYRKLENVDVNKFGEVLRIAQKVLETHNLTVNNTHRMKHLLKVSQVDLPNCT